MTQRRYLLLVALGLPACFHTTIHPKAIAHQRQGAALIAAGDFDAAHDHCAIALEYNPDYINALDCMAIVHIAAGRLHDAAAAYKAILALNDERPETHNNRGKVLLDLGEYQRAIDAFSQAIELDPGYVVARRNLTAALLRNGQRQEARKQARRCLAIAPSACDCHLSLGVLALQDNALGRAESHFSQATRHCPDDANGHYNLGISRLRQEKCIQARGAFDEALKLNPGFLEAEKNREEAVRCGILEREAMHRR